MEKPHWRATALAIATAVLLAVSASDASALALGRVTVQSALGEPLRAEIDIPEINAEELASLRAVIASPEAFRAAGFDYNPAMANIQITLQRRPDGRHFLRLASQRAVNDPFIDLILEANWSSGRIVRDYTMLFDPPSLRQGAPAVAAQVAPAAPAARPPVAAAPAQTARAAPARTPSGRPAPSLPEGSKPPQGDGKQVTVKSGDTAGRIAAANKPTSISLDQMLIAMLRANPEAFVRGNVNRLKAGAVLTMPTAEEAELVPSEEAHQDIIAQSRDFNDFRRRLAEGLPASSVGGSERQASGRVQAKVEEKKPAATAPDKLMLSKGAVEGRPGTADKIARDRAAKDDATRLAELNKNIADLNKLGTATAPAASGSATRGVALPMAVASASKPAPAPAGTVAAASAPKPAPVATTAAASAPKPAPAPAVAAVPAPASAPKAAVPASAPIVTAAASASSLKAASAAVSPPAPAPVTAATTAAPASAPTAVAASTNAASAAASPTTPGASATVAAAPAVSASKPRPAPVAPPPETSLVDDLLENPLVPASVGGVLALLLGFGFYRAQQRKKTTQVDSSFLESRLQPDSFFGASGGQRIDTNEPNATGSSMVYSPSQLDAAGDVDPVAEADVYLAYGRDLQAEEILKEAIRLTPQRVAVHSKLLEIYSKRRDAKAFELVATEAYALTRGEGTEWEHICELGKELDPGNALYHPGGQPAQSAAAAPVAAKASEFSGQATVPMAATPEAPVDLDLDLDFSIGDDTAAPVLPEAPPAPEPTLTMRRPTATEPPMPALDMDFGAFAAPAEATAPAPQADAVRLDAPSPNVSSTDLSFAATAPIKPAPQMVPAQPPAADAGMIEFDLGALSLDLDSPPPAEVPVVTTKMAARQPPEAEDSGDSTAGSPISTGGLDSTDSGDPLATKLALAQEFNAIGDPDGARSLAQEVLAEASGDLKQKAQRFLAEIT